MCGIHGLLTSKTPFSSPTQRLQPEKFFNQLSQILTYSSDNLLSEALSTDLKNLQSQCQLWVDKDGFLLLSEDEELRNQLQQYVHELEGWTSKLEQEAQSGEWKNQSSVEQLNELILLSSDLTWTLKWDALANLERVFNLLNSQAACPQARTHAWSLNIILNGIDRLEVRGRDSAGIAVYAHFEDSTSLEQFISELSDQTEWAQQFIERLSLKGLTQGTIVRPESSPSTLLFTFKTAEEVGKMGDNVNTLRDLITTDPIFQKVIRFPKVQIQALAHTRWASNGIVSLENCHPVDSALIDEQQAIVRGGELVAVLNGDIDNYQELCQKYISSTAFEFESSITTDAKIIPVVIDAYYKETGDFEKAFLKAFSEFEGSMAIGVMAAHHPGKILFAQKGSGQGLYFGFGQSTTAVASEMYGLVELTPTYFKAEGERSEQGEIFVVKQHDTKTRTRFLCEYVTTEIPEDRVQKAEITTRDINRGDYPHFLLKEVTESVSTVRKTLRGRFENPQDSEPTFNLGAEVLDPDRLKQFCQGKIRTIQVIGQGTAAIAGDGIARLIKSALANSKHPIEVVSQKATELSAHGLRDDMSDTLIIAVSQSGTTTDTNCTVDLVRERGAWVLGIVNRRNSDLVYKSHGVLYTSDGRDIEMSVASTKAFYAQNVVGEILALALAQAIGSLTSSQLKRRLNSLECLPQAMEQTLTLSDSIYEIAQQFAPRKKYWAMVGSGSSKVAADEIRIKLSELCYKSIASDFTEDKKHIDLSSEPLILVCASGVQEELISDLVKEVAIFKAHQSIPIVITTQGESRFNPYASGIVAVPKIDGELGYLLSTMVGHLFGYHAACSFDHHADTLRHIRSGLAQARSQQTGQTFSFESLELADEWLSQAHELRNLLLDGSLDSCLDPGTATRLALLLQAALSRTPFELPASIVPVTNSETLVEALLDVTSQAIHELARPVDAIKHQAKTVTVGISRGESKTQAGALWQAIESCELEQEQISEAQKAFLWAFDPLVAEVEGSTLYHVHRLDALGRPRDDSRISVIEKQGSAKDLNSRCDEDSLLSGTKWGVVKRGEIYLGLGQTDNRKILILPAIGERPEGHLLLLHLSLKASPINEERLPALSMLGNRFEKLKIAITEHHQSWDPQMLEGIDNETLFFKSPEEVAEAIEKVTV